MKHESARGAPHIKHMYIYYVVCAATDNCDCMHYRLCAMKHESARGAPHIKHMYIYYVVCAATDNCDCIHYRLYNRDIIVLL